jgi:S1-C subfamily serine protease
MKALGAAVLLAAAAGACAPPGAAPAPERASAPASDSVVPGTIGVLVRADTAGVVVSAVGERGPAARGGLRVGDLIVSYNGEPVSSPRQFYRLMVDSRPGSVARLEVRRDGALRELEIYVEQLDTMPRA